MRAHGVLIILTYEVLQIYLTIITLTAQYLKRQFQNTQEKTNGKSFH